MYHIACSTLNNAPSGTDGKTGEPGVKRDGIILKLKLCYSLSLLSCLTLMLGGRDIAQWLSSRLMVRSWVQSLAEVAGEFFWPVNSLCWLLVPYQIPIPNFHPSVTAVACKTKRPQCQRCTWQVGEFSCPESLSDLFLFPFQTSTPVLLQQHVKLTQQN